MDVRQGRSGGNEVTEAKGVLSKMYDQIKLMEADQHRRLVNPNAWLRVWYEDGEMKTEIVDVSPPEDQP